MTIVSDHDCANDRIIINSNKKKVIVNLDLLINDQTRLVVRRLVAENCLP